MTMTRKDLATARRIARLADEGMTMTRKDLATARRIARLADQGGTIQDDRLVRIMRDPRDHRTMSLREAWSIILPHLDADEIKQALSMTMTRKDRATARRIARLADEGGTIQPERLISVMRDPRDHRTMSLREAWSIILPHLDASEIGEALWG